MILSNPILLAKQGASASIAVTGLSSTDTVYATNGSKTRYGMWISSVERPYFLIDQIDSFGTWNVVASTGVSSDVLVDQAVMYIIRLGVLYLYNEGNECTSITGGWTSSGYSVQNYKIHDATKYSNSMYTYMDWNVSPGNLYLLGTTNKIDFSEFTTIHMTGNVTGVYTLSSYSFGILLFVMSTKTRSANSGQVLNAYLNSLGDFDVSYDISNLNDEYYVQIAPEWAVDSKGYFYNIWLE